MRGKNATPFDVECKGDWSGFDYRMLFLEFTDVEGNKKPNRSIRIGVAWEVRLIRI